MLLATQLKHMNLLLRRAKDHKKTDTRDRMAVTCRQKRNCNEIRTKFTSYVNAKVTQAVSGREAVNPSQRLHVDRQSVSASVCRLTSVLRVSRYSSKGDGRARDQHPPLPQSALSFHHSAPHCALGPRKFLCF